MSDISNKSSALQRLDNKNLDPEEGEIIAFSCVRNEILRLPYFLEYYRRLGVDRFIFIDNASTDNTVEFLLSQFDSHVFYTEESYASSGCGIVWLNELLSEYGNDHWILMIEPDELLVYPMCESVTLSQLTRYLDSAGAGAMKTFLIDMYSEKPIKETYYKTGEPFLDYCDYFDSNSYFKLDGDNIATRGGPRFRLFWEGYDRNKPSPYLINIPLVKWNKSLSYTVGAGTHLMSNANLSSLTGAKQHFKFFSDFYAYAESESKRKEHWNNASEYVAYWEVLSENPELSAMYEGSIRYENSMQLVDLGLMKMPDEYADFIKK